MERKKMAFFYRFNAKIGVFLQIEREKLPFFGVNFILQKFCVCKKNDKYEVCCHWQMFSGNSLFGLVSKYMTRIRTSPEGGFIIADRIIQE